MKWLPLALLLMAVSVRAGVAVPYDPVFDFGSGVLGNGETVGIVVPRSMVIPANTFGSVCTATTAATGSSAFLVTDTPYGGSPTTIATFTFAANAAVCTFSTQAGLLVSRKDTITITGPATADARLAGVRITIRATTTDYP